MPCFFIMVLHGFFPYKILEKNMANIKTKPINELDSWNTKELRKLRITVKNRIESLKASSKPKALPETHPLKEMGVEECQRLLEKVMKAEKAL